MKVLHIVPGLDDPANGIAAAARLIASRQPDSQLLDASQLVTGIGNIGNTSTLATFDEVWLHSMWTPAVLRAAWELRNFPGRLIRMPHGCLSPVSLAYHSLRKRALSPVERFLMRRAGTIAAASEAEKGWCLRFLGRKHPPVEVVPLFPALPQDVPAPVSPRKLLFIGRMHPLKGLDILIRAMPPDASLEIAGPDGGEEAKLRNLAAELRKNVSFLGVVRDDAKNAAFARCDALVLPTLSENYGLAPAEALFAGKGAIVTDGAPFWRGRPGVRFVEGFVAASPALRVSLLASALE